VPGLILSFLLAVLYHSLAASLEIWPCSQRVHATSVSYKSTQPGGRSLLVVPKRSYTLLKKDMPPVNTYL